MLTQDILLKLSTGEPAQIPKQIRKDCAALDVKRFSIDEARAFRCEIDAVNLAAFRPDPFSTFEYIANFNRHNLLPPDTRSHETWILTITLSGRLVGYVALIRIKSSWFGIPVSRIELLVTRTTDRPQLVALPGYEQLAAEAIYGWLVKHKSEWSFIEWRQQDSNSLLFPPPATITEGNYLVREWPSLPNGTVTIRWKTLGDYFLSMQKKFRTNLARQMRKLQQEGELELLSSSDPSVTPLLLDLYCRIETTSWKADAGVAIGGQTPMLEFYRGLLAEDQPMRVTVKVLLLDNAPVAALILGSFKQGLYALNVVYDERLGRVAPGSAVLLMGMHQAIEGRYRFLNFLSGFGYYKVKWLAEMTETVNGQLYLPGTLPYWKRLAGDLRRRLQSLRTQTAKDGKEIRPSGMSFNPLRRRIRPLTEDQQTARTPKSAISMDVDRQLARIREGDTEILNAREIASVLHFTVRK